MCILCDHGTLEALTAPLESLSPGRVADAVRAAREAAGPGVLDHAEAVLRGDADPVVEAGLYDEVVGRALESGVLSSMHEGVLLVDEQGQILLHNSAAMEMLFLGPRPLGKPLREVLEHASLLDLIQQALEGQNHSCEIEISSPSPRTL